MVRRNSSRLPQLEWAVASIPIDGEVVSGDLHLVKPFANGILLAVIDGAGHGREAALAAEVAAAILQRNPGESPIALATKCHKMLRRTRGAVMTVVSFATPDRALTWLGVGNVNGWLVRADNQANPPREHVMLHGGMLGYRLPAMQASVLPVADGDLLIITTDGIEPAFGDEVKRDETPRKIADRIMASRWKGGDDGLVLVARFTGIRNKRSRTSRLTRSFKTKETS